MQGSTNTTRTLKTNLVQSRQQAAFNKIGAMAFREMEASNCRHHVRFYRQYEEPRYNSLWYSLSLFVVGSNGITSGVVVIVGGLPLIDARFKVPCFELPLIHGQSETSSNIVTAGRREPALPGFGLTLSRRNGIKKEHVLALSSPQTP